jgi:hypothetical protein
MKELPAEFAMLEPFVARWAGSTQNERDAARWSSSEKEINDFYTAMLPLLPDILAAVDRFPLGELPDDHKTLFELACSFAMIAPHAELYKGNPDVPNAFEEPRMIADHGAIPTWTARTRKRS